MDCGSMMQGYGGLISMMQGYGGLMMWGMGLFRVLVLIVLLLGAAALSKYVFFTRREPGRA